jgi:hypothetical protein
MGNARPAPASPARRRRLVVLAAAIVAAVVAVAVMVALTGGDGEPAAAPEAPATTAPVREVFPLTGQPVGDRATAARPPLSIKIENVAAARPQAGLNAADVVTEELVEGGLTRLLATYHSTDAPLVGPVRSARPVDAALLRQLGGGLFAFSGAARAVLDQIRRDSGATLVGPDEAPDAYRRLAAARAPHDLFSSTTALYAAGRAADAGLGPPRPILSFAATPPAGARPVRGIRLRFSPSSRAAWQWQASRRLFERLQDGTLHRLRDGRPVTTDNIVVLHVTIGRTAITDAAGNPTPDVDVLGEGAAWVLRDGRAVTGRWQRGAVGDPVRLTGPGGGQIRLRPGRTWIELLPATERPELLTAG